MLQSSSPDHSIIPGVVQRCFELSSVDQALGAPGQKRSYEVGPDPAVDLTKQDICSAPAIEGYANHGVELPLRQPNT
jgi:hypothetical protein